MPSSAEYRQRARNLLGNNIFSPLWLYPLVVALLASAANGIASIIPFLSLIIYGPITLGIEGYFLARAKKNMPYDNISCVLDGFKGDIVGNILLGFLYSLFITLWSLVFIIPGIVKIYAYSMAFYIKLDHPEYTATQAITESRRLMKGHKMRLFILDLSFIGWHILGALCFAIGFLWVNPYVKAARAEFYKDLVKKALPRIP